MTRRLALIGLLCLAAAPGAPLAQDYSPQPVSRESAVLRSVLVPGLGQIEQGRTGRGALWTGGAVVLAATAFFAHMEYHSAAMDLENAQDSYRRALADGDGDAAQTHFTDMQRLGPIADDRHGTRRNLEIALGVWWAGNLVDTWLFDGGQDDEAMASDTAVLPGRLSPVLRGGAAGLAWSLDF